MVSQYGLLTFVLNNNDALTPQQSACSNSSAVYAKGGTAGLTKVMGLPNDAIAALGYEPGHSHILCYVIFHRCENVRLRYMGKYLVVVPSEGLVVVAFGSHQASLKCDAGSGGAWSSEEGLIMSELWRALGSGIRNSSTGSAPHAAAKVAPTGDALRGAKPDGAKGRSPAQAQGHSNRTEAGGVMTGASPPVTAGGSLQADPAGACYCYCGGGQAIGQCFDDATDQSECEGRNAVGAVPAAVVQMYCPEAALFLDCHDEPSASDCPGMLCPSSTDGMMLCRLLSHRLLFLCRSPCGRGRLPRICIEFYEDQTVLSWTYAGSADGNNAVFLFARGVRRMYLGPQGIVRLLALFPSPQSGSLSADSEVRNTRFWGNQRPGRIPIGVFWLPVPVGSRRTRAQAHSLRPPTGVLALAVPGRGLREVQWKLSLLVVLNWARWPAGGSRFDSEQCPKLKL